MSNKHNRLLLDIVSHEKCGARDQEVACVTLELEFGIKVQPVPSFKKILHKKVLVPHNEGCKTKKILKVKHRA